MDTNDTECSTKPTCSKRLSEASKADSSFEQEWAEVQPQAEKLEKTILAVAEKCGMGAHGIKGIINRIYKHPELIKYSMGAASNLELPSIKITRRMVKLMVQGSQEKTADAESPAKQISTNNTISDDTAEEENGEDESGDGESGDEECLPSTQDMTEDELIEEEEATERGTAEEDEPMEYEEQLNEDDDIVVPKFANLNDAAIYDDLAQSNHDLFDPGVRPSTSYSFLSPGGYGNRSYDPEYQDFLNTINSPTRGNYNEEDDPDYEPQEDPPEELDFSQRSPDWEQEEQLFKEFVASATLADPEYNMNLDIPDDDSEDDADYNPQEDEESDDDKRFSKERISKREYRRMIEDVDESKAAMEAQREREAESRRRAREFRQNNKREPRDYRDFKVAAAADDQSCSLITGEFVTFNHSELSQLMMQMEQHVQLTLQGLSQCYNQKYLRDERNGHQAIINELDAFYYEFGQNSFFNVDNLAQAVTSCHDLHAVKLMSPEYSKWAMAPSDVSGFMPRPETCLVLSRSQAILYPELVPFMQSHKHLLLSPAFSNLDDVLLLLGLIQFGHVRNCSRFNPRGRYYQVAKNLLPNYTVDQIRARMANVRKQVAPSILSKLIVAAEDENPSLVFPPSFMKRIIGGMYTWEEEDQPCWFQTFSKWFSVADDYQITFTGCEEEEDTEFVVKKKRRKKEKPIVKDKDTYGKTNYVCVSKHLRQLAEDQGRNRTEEGGNEGEDGEETAAVEEEEAGDTKETWLRDTTEYQDMPCLDNIDVERVSPSDLALGGVNAVMLIGSPEKGFKKIDLTGKKVYIAKERAPETSPQLFRHTTEENIPRDAEEITTPKKHVFRPVTPKNSPESENFIKEAQPTAKSSEAEKQTTETGETNNNEGEESSTKEVMRQSDSTTKSKRKQYFPVKKLPVARKDLRKRRSVEKPENHKHVSPGALKRLRDSLDMSSDSEREEEEEVAQEEVREKYQRKVSRHHHDAHCTTSSLHMADYSDMPSTLVFPLVVNTGNSVGGAGNGGGTRSNSFVPITPHAVSPSGISSSGSPGGYPDYMRTPSPDYEGSQLPAPRTPRDDGMTLSPTLMRSCAAETTVNYDLTTGFSSARRRLRHFGPTDFSSIDDSQTESDSLQHEPDREKKKEIVTNSPMLPGPSKSAVDANKKRKRGRDEIMRDGSAAMMDEDYRQRQEGLIAKHVFNDIKRRLSMHRDVLSQINNAMVSGKTPGEILNTLDVLLRENHLDTLCLISLTFDIADVPPRLLGDPLRKAYHDALNMIMAIDAYSSQVKNKMSTKHLFRTLKSRCCSGDTTASDFVAVMEELFRNDKPLWEYLKPHMPMNYEKLPVAQEVEFIDMTTMTSMSRAEHVDLGRVLGTVPNKKKNKVHVQNGKMYVFKNGSYAQAEIHKAPEPAAVPCHPKPKPPKAPRKPTTKHKASPKKAEHPPIQSELPVEPQWTPAMDMLILTTYNEMVEDDEEAVVEALLPKIPFSKQLVAARIKFLVDQFDTV